MRLEGLSWGSRTPVLRSSRRVCPEGSGVSCDTSRQRCALPQCERDEHSFVLKAMGFAPTANYSAPESANIGINSEHPAKLKFFHEFKNKPTELSTEFVD